MLRVSEKAKAVMNLIPIVNTENNKMGCFLLIGCTQYQMILETLLLLLLTEELRNICRIIPRNLSIFKISYLF